LNQTLKDIADKTEAGEKDYQDDERRYLSETQPTKDLGEDPLPGSGHFGPGGHRLKIARKRTRLKICIKVWCFQVGQVCVRQVDFRQQAVDHARQPQSQKRSDAFCKRDRDHQAESNRKGCVRPG